MLSRLTKNTNTTKKRPGHSGMMRTNSAERAMLMQVSMTAMARGRTISCRAN